MESGKDLYIDPDLARDQYLANFARHGQEIERLCRELGISFHQMVTSRPLELAMFDFVQSRMRAKRQVLRSGNRALAAPPSPVLSRS
jgi:hypothetical protein